MEKKTIYWIIAILLLLVVVAKSDLLSLGTTVFDPETRQSDSTDMVFSLSFGNDANDIGTNQIGDERIGVRPIYVCDDDYDENEFKDECYRYYLRHAQKGSSLNMDKAYMKEFGKTYSMNEYLDYSCQKNDGYINDEDGSWDLDERYRITCDFVLDPSFIEISANDFVPEKKYFGLNEEVDIKINIYNNMYGFDKAGYIVDYYVSSGIQRDISPYLVQQPLDRGKNVFTVDLYTEEESLIETEIPIYVEITNKRFKLDKKLSFNFIVGKNIFESHKGWLEYPKVLNNSNGKNNGDSGQEDPEDEDNPEKLCSDFIYTLPTHLGEDANCDKGFTYAIIAGGVGLVIIILLLRKKKK